MLLLWAPMANPRIRAVCLEQSLIAVSPLNFPALATGQGWCRAVE